MRCLVAPGAEELLGLQRPSARRFPNARREMAPQVMLHVKLVKLHSWHITAIIGAHHHSSSLELTANTDLLRAHARCPRAASSIDDLRTHGCPQMSKGIHEDRGHP